MNRETIAEFLEDQAKAEATILKAIKEFHEKYLLFIRPESQPIVVKWSHSHNPNIVKAVKLNYSVRQSM